MRILITGILIFCFTLFILFSLKNSFVPKNLEKILSPTIKQAGKQEIKPVYGGETEDLFIPYWVNTTKINRESSYKNFIYFGITADTNGINKTEAGFKSLPTFLENIDSNKSKILVIRLLNQSTNEEVLSNKNLQNLIIEESSALAKKNNFNSILLDFEYSALNFEDVSNSITNFIENFSNIVHENDLQFFVSAYGDNFYRARPFNIKKISEKVDGIYVLAYDFHKAKGNPGPNFPFDKLDDEDYSFKNMVSDFMSSVPSNKIVITFGLFGYDWIVGEKGTSLKQAASISLNEAKQKFLNNCKEKNCKIKTNSAKEEEVTFTDENGQNHDVWIETEESIRLKKELLRSKNITKTAIWAYSYF